MTPRAGVAITTAGDSAGCCRQSRARSLPNIRGLRLARYGLDLCADAPVLASPRRLMTHHPVDRVVVDHPLFREPSYPVLTRHDVALRGDLGTYRA